MSPSGGTRYAPRFSVEVGGTEFNATDDRVAELDVETSLSGPDRFSVTFAYPFDERRGSFSGLDWNAFEIGAEVAIAMGYGGDSRRTPLVTGRIETIEGSFTDGSGPTVAVSGYGPLRAMIRGTNSASWSETALGDVVEEICSSYNFEGVSVSADLRRPTLIQDEQSDYAFLSGLAERYGFECYVDRGTLRFERRRERRRREPVAELTYRQALREFEAERSDRQSTHAVEVRAWDPKRAEEVVETAGPTDARNTTVRSVSATSRAEARRIATEHHERLADGRLECTGVADGTPQLRAGATVSLEGLGDRFSGRYAVTDATHRLGPDGYRTTFDGREVPS